MVFPLKTVESAAKQHPPEYQTAKRADYGKQLYSMRAVSFSFGLSSHGCIDAKLRGGVCDTRIWVEFAPFSFGTLIKRDRYLLTDFLTN